VALLLLVDVLLADMLGPPLACRPASVLLVLLLLLELCACRLLELLAVRSDLTAACLPADACFCIQTRLAAAAAGMLRTALTHCCTVAIKASTCSMRQHPQPTEKGMALQQKLDGWGWEG
jgi:hypothetical protein